MKGLQYPPFPPALYPALPLPLNLTSSNFKTFLSSSSAGPSLQGRLAVVQEREVTGPI